MKQRLFFFGSLLSFFGGVVVSAILQNYRPFILSPIASGIEWEIVLWVNKGFIVATSGLICLCLFFYWQKKELLLCRALRFGIFLGIVFIVFASVYVAAKIYFLWIGEDFTKYLLPPYSQYYYTIVWRYASPYVFGIGTGAIVSVILFLISRWQSSRALNALEIYTVLWMSIVLGSTFFVEALVTTVMAAILFGLLRRQREIRLVPYLLLFFYFFLNGAIYGLDWILQLIA